MQFKLILFFILLQMGLGHGAAIEGDFQSYNTNKRGEIIIAYSHMTLVPNEVSDVILTPVPRKVNRNTDP
jgi:hypothetical protein